MVHLQPEGPDLSAPLRRRRLPPLALAPILFKDFTIAGRRGRTYVWRTLGVGVIGLALVMGYWNAIQYTHWRGARAMADAGGMIFQGLIWTSFAIVALAAPAGVVGSVTEERDRRTLGLLIASPLRPWRVAIGKVLGSLLRTATWTLALVPLLFGLLTFRGIEPGQVASGLAWVGVVGLLAVSISLLFVTQRTAGPHILIRTYMILVAYLIILPLIWEEILGWDEGVLGYAPWMAWNPFMGLWGEVTNWGPIDVVTGPYASLGIGLLCVAAGTAILARRLSRYHEGAPASPRGRAWLRLPVGRMPVFWYESHIRPRRHRRAWRRTALIGLGIVTILGVAIAIEERGRFGYLAFTLAFGWTVLFMIEVVLHGAWTGGDPRSEVLLFLSPMPSRRVALEKIAAILRRSVRSIAFIGLAFGLAIASGEESPHWSLIDLLLVVGCLSLAAVGIGSMGALLGRATRSTSRGTVLMLSILVCVGIGVPILGEWSGLRDRAWAVLAGATDPLFFAGWVFAERPQRSWEFGVAALGIEAVLVVVSVGLTVALWGPLTRRAG